MKDLAKGFEAWWDSRASFKKITGVWYVIVKHGIAEEAWRAARATCPCKEVRE